RFWDNPGTAALRVVRRAVPIESPAHRATLAGQALDAAAHLPALREGFAATYRLLVREREALLADHGPVAAFADDPVPFIAGGTCLFDFAPESALERTRRRIHGMGEADLARQLWTIGAAFASRQRFAVSGGAAPSNQQPTARHDLLAAACRVGDRLAGRAIER